DGGAEADPFGTGRDRGERHVARWHREVAGVVLADPEEVHPGLLGEDALLHHVADRLGVRQRLAVGALGPGARGGQAQGGGPRGRGARASGGGASPAPTPGRPGAPPRPPRSFAKRPGSSPPGPRRPAMGAPAGGSPPATRGARRSGAPAGRARSSSSW